MRSPKSNETLAISRIIYHAFNESESAYIRSSKNTAATLRVPVFYYTHDVTTPKKVLQSTFGHKKFRPGQQEIISALLAKKSVLAILPTGAGKSLCYQVPGVMMDGTTLVISPLISLMQDQVTGLLRRNIAAAYLSSTQTDIQRQQVLYQLQQGRLKFLYVAPERLQSNSFQNTIKAVPINFLVVDEAHCISTWGHQFRPSYRSIYSFIKKLPQRVSIAAFTATATPTVADDIVESLGMSEPLRFSQSFHRPNLTINSYPCTCSTERDLALFRLLKHHQNEPGIIYATTRNMTEELCERIQLFFPSLAAKPYHAGLSAQERTNVQEQFVNGNQQLIVATTAFGMGVDKPNVRFVIHYQLPANIENYYQEIGRAGRDQLQSQCYLLSTGHDIEIQTRLIQTGSNQAHIRVSEQKLKEIAKYAVSKNCLHRLILDYFSENGSNCENHCSNCIGLYTPHSLLFGIDDQEKQTLAALLKKRESLSEQQHLPNRAIATDKQLCWLALMNPTKKEDCVRLPGFGKGWVEQWWEFFAFKADDDRAQLPLDTV